MSLPLWGECAIGAFQAFLLLGQRSGSRGQAVLMPDRLVSRSLGIVAEPAPRDGFGTGSTRFARQLWWERRLRTRFFPSEIFSEPAWDLMLAVMAAEATGDAVRLSKSHLSACAPPTLAARRAKGLVAIGILETKPINARSRALQLGLTASARDKLESLLSETQFHRLESLAEAEASEPASGRGQRVQHLRQTLTKCLFELDALAAWTAAAHVTQAIEALSGTSTAPS